MTRPTRVEINCETGVETIIEYTDAEIAQMEKEAAEYAKARAQKQAEEDARAEAKTSALAKLAALGLTEEETAALIG